MIGLSVHLEGDGCWPDLSGKDGRQTYIEGNLTSVARLAVGTVSGNSSVALRIELPDGQVVIAQTTMKLFLGAARAFAAKEGEELS